MLAELALARTDAEEGASGSSSGGNSSNNHVNTNTVLTSELGRVRTALSKDLVNNLTFRAPPEAFNPPNFPHLPVFHSWPNENLLAQALWGYGEYSKLLTVSLRALGQVQLKLTFPELDIPTSTYLRYFRPEQLCEVQTNFGWLLGQDEAGFARMPELQIRYHYDKPTA